MFLLICSAVVVATWFVVFWIQPLVALRLFERVTPNVIYRVPTDLPLVALSFDDGPHPTFTPEVLDILERHDAKATFFLIGERALRYRELVARIKAAAMRSATITTRIVPPSVTRTLSSFVICSRLREQLAL